MHLTSTPLRIENGEQDFKAFYSTNNDHRENLLALEMLTLRQAAVDALVLQSKSVACLIAKEYLKRDPEGRYSLNNPTTLGKQLTTFIPKGFPYQVDPAVRFQEEPVAGYATGCIVGEDLILVSAHSVCLPKTDVLDPHRIKKTRIVFDFVMTSKEECQQTLTVYKIKQVVAHQFIQGEHFRDWALIQLTQKIQGRAPLILEDNPSLAKSQPVYMLGHPSGLPLKYTYEGTIVETTHPEYFRAHLDAFKGNSGSPVFDAITKKVIGMLVCGQRDFAVDPDKKFLTMHRMTDVEIAKTGSETVHKILPDIIELIRAINQNSPDLPTLLQSLQEIDDAATIDYEDEPEEYVEPEEPVGQSKATLGTISDSPKKSTEAAFSSVLTIYETFRSFFFN